jgi:hypothetical protein
LSLRRTLSTHPSGTALADDSKFARLEFGAFYFAIAISIFYGFVLICIKQIIYFSDNLRKNDKKKPIMINAPVRLMLQAK